MEPHSLPYAKYSGCGNEFVLVDDRNLTFSFVQEPFWIQRLCDRLKGPGADGVIFLNRSRDADFKMRIFNSDGSEAEMCGNGLRCFALFLEQLGFPTKSYTVEVAAHFLRIHSRDGQEIETEMPPPKNIRWNLLTPTPWGEAALHTIDTGVPHAVYVAPPLEGLPFEEAAPLLRWHPFWGSRGTNVTFITEIEGSDLAIRTFERGVEAETAACGTGATAAALVAHHLFHLPSPITVRMPSQEKLTILFETFGLEILSVKQRGGARFLGRGVWQIPRNDNPQDLSSKEALKITQ